MEEREKQREDNSTALSHDSYGKKCRLSHWKIKQRREKDDNGNVSHHTDSAVFFPIMKKICKREKIIPELLPDVINERLYKDLHWTEG